MTDTSDNFYDCIIIGGGAAGLMCAGTAARRGRKILVLDSSNKVGKKILMSGGGRCNFTNYVVESANYICTNPHFCKSALKRFTQYDFLGMVQRHQIPFHERSLGQLFCDQSSRDILDMLLAECHDAGVKIEIRCDITRVATIEAVDEPASAARFQLATSLGTFRCHSLVVATGGLSIPTLGSSGFGYDLAKQFGLRLKPRHAALVPFTLKGALLSVAQSLAGVSLPVVAQCNGSRFREALLFTHKGLSGPSMLQISNYWYPNDSIEINFLPDERISDLIAAWQREGSKSEIKNLLSRHLPKRFVIAWLEQDDEGRTVAVKRVAQLSAQDIKLLEQRFHAWQCVPAGTEGYKTAEVTRGGVDTDEVSSKTFETKKVPGLYFVGEVLDVTGWLGGFNFQWAWASGWCAAQYV